MKNIGVIVAMKEEFEALYNRIGDRVETVSNGYREIYHYKRGDLNIYVTDSAEGEIAASCMTQFLITKYNVEIILNFGLCGSLNPDIHCGDLVVVNEVIHYAFDLTALNHNFKVGQYFGYKDNIFNTDKKLINHLKSISPIKEVRVASADKFVGDEATKNQIIKDFKADICEMESAGITLCSLWNNVPCLLIKCVSDNASDDAHIEFREVVKNGVTAYVDLIDKLFDSLNCVEKI